MSLTYEKYLQVKNIPGKGKGVITTVKIPSQLPIIEFKGTVFKKEDMPSNLTEGDILQIGDNLYIGSSGTVDDYINHKCSPNCYLHIVGNRAILYSMYLIQPNTEITFDYSLSSTATVEEYSFNCDCGNNCRGIISGHQYLNAEILEKNKNILPLYIKLENLKG